MSLEMNEFRGWKWKNFFIHFSSCLEPTINLNFQAYNYDDRHLVLIQKLSHGEDGKERFGKFRSKFQSCRYQFRKIQRLSLKEIFNQWIYHRSTSFITFNLIMR